MAYLPVHQELTGIMMNEIENKVPESEVNDMALTHWFNHTSTNAMWNYSTPIIHDEDFEIC